jgi:hypothetical protein
MLYLVSYFDSGTIDFHVYTINHATRYGLNVSDMDNILPLYHGLLSLHVDSQLPGTEM